jgi:hypothetical protein
LTDTATTTDAAAHTEGDGTVGESTQAQAQAAITDQQAQPATLVEGGETPKTEEADTTSETQEPEGAPEAYEDFAMPEGVQIAPEVLGDLKDLAKELNLPQDKAQKVADLGAKLAQRWAGQAAEAQETAAAEWLQQSQTDKDFGGDKLTESVATAKQALDTYGTPQLRELLNQTKLGNHPEVVRFMVSVGKTLAEDKPVVGTNGVATAPKSHADRIFPVKHVT